MQKFTITRRFSYNGMILPDPNPSLAPEEAVRLLSGGYPELANAKIEPQAPTSDGTQTYRVSVFVGTKG
jgi:PRTRC genetic system protein C